MTASKFKKNIYHNVSKLLLSACLGGKQRDIRTGEQEIHPEVYDFAQRWAVYPIRYYIKFLNGTITFKTNQDWFNEEGRAYIVTGNHASYFDIPLLSELVKIGPNQTFLNRRIYYLARDTLMVELGDKLGMYTYEDTLDEDGKEMSLEERTLDVKSRLKKEKAKRKLDPKFEDSLTFPAKLFQTLGCIFINQEQPLRSEIKRVLDVLNDKGYLSIFYEGTRTVDGSFEQETDNGLVFFSSICKVSPIVLPYTITYDPCPGRGCETYVIAAQPVDLDSLDEMKELKSKPSSERRKELYKIIKDSYETIIAQNVYITANTLLSRIVMENLDLMQKEDLLKRSMQKTAKYMHEEGRHVDPRLLGDEFDNEYEKTKRFLIKHGNLKESGNLLFFDCEVNDNQFKTKSSKTKKEVTTNWLYYFANKTKEIRFNPHL